MSRRERRKSSGRSSQSKKSNDQKKLALIAVLVVGLIIAVVTMPESEDPDSVASVAATPVSVSPPASEPAVSGPSPTGVVAGNSIGSKAIENESDPSLGGVPTARSSARVFRRWTLEEVSALRPIRPPAWESAESQLDMSTPVQAIYRSGNHANALMRGTVVRRGSVLGRDQHVDAITSDGIRVRKTAPR